MSLRNLPSQPGSHGREGRSGSEAVEDYAKAIHSMAGRSGEAVGTGELAERLGVAPGTVTAMLKRMAAMGLLRHRPYRGVELTDDGERLALEVIRHHRLIEAFLAEALGMPWDRVHDEAEVLEHYISEDLEQRIADLLGNPAFDPHGDPIPDADLGLSEDKTVSLAQLGEGDSGVLARVSDSDPGMLRYLAERGIGPGDELEVVARAPYGGPVEVRVDDAVHPLGVELAAAIRVDLGGRSE